MERNHSKMRYFAYGSNMYTNRLLKRVPSCGFVAVAVLKKHILRFHKKSIDGSGKCNAYYTGNERDEIIGIVFDIDPADKQKLDEAEGLGHGYHEKEVKVHYTEGYIEAFMYEADNQAIDDLIRPYTWYKDFVVKGAKEHNLAETYIEKLEAVLADIDPDKSREQTNRQVIDDPPRLANRVSNNPEHSTESRRFFSNLLEIKLEIWYNASN